MKSKKVFITALANLLSRITGGNSIDKSDLEKSAFIKGEGIFRSPWLGIEISQNGEKVEMMPVPVSSDREDGSPPINIKVRMAAKPFTLTFPKITENDVVKVCVWKEHDIFQKARKGIKTKEIPYFRRGTGFAAERYIPTLWIDKDGHNYFIGNRLDDYSESQNGILVFKFGENGQEYKVSKQKEPLYMVVFIDRNTDEEIGHDEVEYFILEFYQLVKPKS